MRDSVCKNNSAKYRILMFAPAFAPFANAEAIVNNKLVIAMLNAGWEVEVISRDLASISNYDYGSGWVEPWLELKKSSHTISYKNGNSLARLVDVLRQSLKMKLPHVGVRWTSRAVDFALELHAKQPFDLVISRAFPEYAHIAAMKFAKITNTPWVANWNDPWEFLRLENVRGSLSSNVGLINAYIIKKIAKHANWHTFPSEKLRLQMIQYMGERVINKSSCIPHVAMKFTTSKMLKNNEFSIAYVGKLSKSQSPALFFKALARLINVVGDENSVVFEFAGIDDVDIGRLAHSISTNIKIKNYGTLTYIDSQILLSNASLLLVIDPPLTKGILLTSKLVDYAQVGQPILALSTPGGTIDELFKKCGGGICANVDSEEAIFLALVNAYKKWKNSYINEELRTENLADQFSSQKAINHYVELLEMHL